MNVGFRLLLTLAVLLSTFWAAQASATTIDFGTTFQLLPYVEDDLTFTNLGTSLAIVSGGGGDGFLTAGTNFDPIRVRVASITPFDLVSFDIEAIFRSWRVETSLGGVLNVSGPATVDFAAQSGFQGITYFEIIHDPAEENGTIGVDNIVVNFVPEPGSWLLIVIGGVGPILWFQRHGRIKHQHAARAA